MNTEIPNNWSDTPIPTRQADAFAERRFENQQQGAWDSFMHPVPPTEQVKQPLVIAAERAGDLAIASNVDYSLASRRRQTR